MYRVISNDKLARFPEIKVHPSWNNCDFDTYEEAEAYVKHWLGQYHGAINYPMIVGKKYDYSGYGDTMSIVHLVEVKFS